MRYLKTNTATTITVGPFLDAADGKTPKVALTATNEHATLVVDNAGTPTLALDADLTASGGGANDFVHITNDDAGYYSLELAAANVNYLGGALLSINYVTDHLPVFHEFTILPANVYDSLIPGTDLLDVNVSQQAGTSITTLTGNYPSLGIVDSGTAQSVDSTHIQLRSAAAFADGELVGTTVLITSASTGAGQARVITDYTGSTDSATVDTWTTTPTGTITYVIFGTPKASTTLLPSVNVTQWLGTACATPTVSGVPEVDITHIAGSAVNTASAQLGVNMVSGAAGAITASVIATNAIDADAIAADAVTEIQSGLATAAALDAVDNYIDTEVAAIKAVTDQMVFTKANELDVNIQSINGAEVVGDGNATPWDGA